MDKDTKVNDNTSIAALEELIKTLIKRIEFLETQEMAQRYAAQRPRLKKG